MLSQILPLPLIWYHWAILGLLFMASELLIPAFVLVWFGLGACLVAALLAVYPATPLNVQMLVWLVASLLFVLVWFGLFKNALHKSSSGRSSAGIVGEVGLLIGDVAMFAPGKVRFQQPLAGSILWDCVSDQPLTAGARVKVVSVEGNTLKIAAVNP